MYKHYRVNDTLFLDIDQAWIENHWVYSYQSPNNTFIIPGFQFNVNCTNELKGYSFDWIIGISGDKYLRSCASTSLMGDFSNLPGDTIAYQVQIGDNLSDESKKVIIGDIMFIKKK